MPSSGHAPVIIKGESYITQGGQTLTLGKISVANQITGTLPEANGGTGQTDLSNLFKAYQVAPNTAQTTTGTTFADMTNGTQSVTLAVTSHVFVQCQGNFASSTSMVIYTQATYDSGGADTVVGDQGYFTYGGAVDSYNIATGGVVTSLVAGTYTFAYQWKVNTGTGTAYDPIMSIFVIPA